jgi:hypothetical protein
MQQTRRVLQHVWIDVNDASFDSKGGWKRVWQLVSWWLRHRNIEIEQFRTRRGVDAESSAHLRQHGDIFRAV